VEIDPGSEGRERQVAQRRPFRHPGARAGSIVTRRLGVGMRQAAALSSEGDHGMTRKVLGLAVILALACWCVPPAAAANDDDGDWTAGVQLLNLNLRSSNLDYAIRDDDDADEFGPGGFENVPMSYDLGGRVWIGYEWASGWETRLGYTWHEAEGEGETEDPDGGGDSDLYATRLHVDSTGTLTDAAAEYEFELGVIDLEMGRWFTPNEFAEVRVFCGVRIASIESELGAVYLTTGGDTDAALETNDIDAYGLRAGIEAEWVWENGWGIFGGLSGSVLSQEVDYTILALDDQTGDVDLENSFTSALTVLETKLGVSWSTGPWRVAGGYELSNWLDASHSTRSPDDIDDHLFLKESFDVLLDGFFLTGSFNW
jgi:hypothetical protein